ncbi:MAG: magnesium/cobalt transporter CorA [Saprospiraceae bacterium]|nr:MAG: magnesium/cobalt transporter CorA [Saprospiraceae bacterium]
MSRTRKQHIRRKKPGAMPGSLEFTGEQVVEQPIILRIQYNEQNFDMQFPAADATITTGEGVVWYDVRGLHDVELIAKYGKHFDIHPLVLEDILHTRQRPKFEEYGNDVFTIVQSLTYDESSGELFTEQIALYFGENYLLSFQENSDDTFAAVRERLESGSGRIRSRKVDYLAYALIDNVVDNYFHVLDQIEKSMEQLEDQISTAPSENTKEHIHHLKFQLLTLRKSVVPLREAINRFSRCESLFINKSSEVFLRDLYDHVIRIADLVDTYRDMVNGLQELYLSELSMRMNKIIQLLTIITTIFVPLTFLAGVYGMNFKNIPELSWHYGYFYLLGLMAIISIVLVFYFRKRKWL